MAQASCVTSSITNSFSSIYHVDKVFFRKKFLQSKFRICTEHEELYTISEKTSFKADECQLLNNYQQSILHLHRPIKFFSSKHETTITSQDALLGLIVKETGWFKTSFMIKDENNETIYTIKGPKIFDSTYRIYQKDETTLVGTFSTKMKFMSEGYQVTFSHQLEIKMKVLILAASIVIMKDLDDRRSHSF